MKWFLIKCLFKKTGMKKALEKFSDKELEEFQNKSVVEEKYELAAYLKCFLELKKAKTKHPAI